MQHLRDRTAVTRALILSHLADGDNLSETARALGITVQAVSNHARSLADEGHLLAEGGAYRVNAAGRQFLHEQVRRIGDAADALRARLADIDLTSAVALDPIQRGATVGLVMRDGDLAAVAAPAASTGIAVTAARPGAEVIVQDLKGVVQLDPGAITLVLLPGPHEGGVAKAKVPPVPPAPVVAAVGTGARLVARAKHHVVHAFAPEQAAFNAAERGLDVLLYVTRDRLPEVQRILDERNTRTLHRIAIRVVEAHA